MLVRSLGAFGSSFVVLAAVGYVAANGPSNEFGPPAVPLLGLFFIGATFVLLVFALIIGLWRRRANVSLPVGAIAVGLMPGFIAGLALARQLAATNR